MTVTVFQDSTRRNFEGGVNIVVGDHAVQAVTGEKPTTTVWDAAGRCVQEYLDTEPRTIINAIKYALKRTKETA